MINGIYYPGNANSKSYSWKEQNARLAGAKIVRTKSASILKIGRLKNFNPT